MIQVPVTQSLDKYAYAKLPTSDYAPLLAQVAGRATTDKEGWAIKRCIDHLVRKHSMPLRLGQSSQTKIEEELWGAMACLIDFVNTPLKVDDVVAKLLAELRHPYIPPNDKEAIFEVWPDYPCER